MNSSSLRKLPPETVREILDALTDAQLDDLHHDWSFWARPEQTAPEGDWNNWFYLAGRGSGKTRTGAEWVRSKVKQGCGRLAFIGPTAADGRDVMVEGNSGILSVSWKHDRDVKGNITGLPLYEPSKRRLTWENGATATIFSAEDPDSLRGPQFEAGWCDELAAWSYMQDTWDMYQFGLRLGDHPQSFLSTTPKPRKLMKELLKDAGTVVSRGSTRDNADNLAPGFLKIITDKYAGTRLGRQELEGELIDEADGALWTRARLEKALHRGTLPDMRRVVVALDPAVTAKAESDETGIIVCGLGSDGFGYALRDCSGRYKPHEWAQIAVNLYHEYSADRIVAETNNGGDMVISTIETEDKTVATKKLHASRGKYARAEPVAALYEQNKVRHLPGLENLEDQLVEWEPLSGLESPDRLDAMVWGMTELMLDGSTYTLDNL